MSVSADRRRIGADRRVHTRVTVDLEVDYKSADNFLFAYITDISAMGIFIRTNVPEPPGSRLNLRFTPPGGPQLNLEGRVMWVNPYRPGSYDNINPGMGVQFIELTRAAAGADREPGAHLRLSVRRRGAQGQQLTCSLTDADADAGAGC